MKKGKLMVITGCMFAGKTTMLIAYIEKAVQHNKKVKVFHPIIDTRYTKNSISSHDKKLFSSLPLSLDTKNIEKGESEIVFLDEVQFFGMEIVMAIQELLKNGTDVVISGLDKDFRGEVFANMDQLVQKADNVICLKAKCATCGKPAVFSQRLASVKSKGNIVVGGADMYSPKCMTCFIFPGDIVNR